MAFPAFLEVIGQTVVDDTKGEILKAFQMYVQAFTAVFATLHGVNQHTLRHVHLTKALINTIIMKTHIAPCTFCVSS